MVAAIHFNDKVTKGDPDMRCEPPFATEDETACELLIHVAAGLTLLAQITVGGGGG